MFIFTSLQFSMRKALQRTILALICTVTLVSAIKNDSCGTGKSAKRVHYPFGFSSDSPIKLNCSKEGEIEIQNFKVQNVTTDSIIINLPAQCQREIQKIEPLFGKNYALSSKNSLLFQNCSSSSSGCVIPTSVFNGQNKLNNCNGKSDNNISCFPLDSESEFMSFANVTGTGCKFLLLSMAVEWRNNSAVSLELGTAQLGWWLDHPCHCAPNAKHTNLTVPGGFGCRCSCKEGFDGDGFKDGDGCQEDCNASKYMSGTCGGTTRVAVLVGGVIVGASLMSTVALICYCIRRRSYLRRRMSAKRLICEAAGNSSVPLYPYKEVERATNGFSEKQRLGTGAYGTVFAGKLHNDEWVAIKKIRNRDNDSIEQVMNEIKLISSVNHPNLVRLLGCCIENGEQILVYEFMANGTLSQHLQKERGKGLPWTTRLNIATETANAIAHLHSAITPPIFHRDIKSSNILLDDNFNSKVADFGLSRLGMTESSHISTAPQGTPGYLDPQYHQNFHLSDKSDVYSFGVVLVEIISAMKVVDFSRPHSEVNLAALAIDRIGRGCVDEIIDPFLEPQRDAWTLCSIHKVAELAFRCLAFHRDMRPSMMEVADELEHVRLSGWAPMEENICVASSVASSCSSPFNGSEMSLGCMSVRKAGIGSRRLFVPHRPTDCLASMEEIKDSSPVSVHDPWLSEQSSPSTNSLLGNVVQ
ncbi:wall-associated receptor kinase-like 14 isoform X1 [Vitis vinifera]|uniref:wall-associated receptor kinase-like 14 isoform X1 n=1 Tax=Vitis vinifera TaxID=29760 RepID=UPI00054019C2|nr:wall-associated receptor kinase-like 14 isoform X1 [Vitis vinifera]|eukprot:XP_010646389.1 PREDICTED: wall-associated receptor kinase-like 14 isoform X2 [Vitis vinifera]